MIVLIRGTLALAGSGEMSKTMVEVHKALISRSEPRGKALFLDTPAGFQENADLLSLRAVKYFHEKVQYDMEVASFKSIEVAATEQAKQVYRLVNGASYLLMGPGSPTYTVRHLKETPIPALLISMITRGGSLMASSAAALTIGTHTIPVYEIYKVGEPLYWIEGMNILGSLGLDLVVIPHWDNAEGGNHDTRYCYMGEKRLRGLEEQLPADLTILGIDEHTVIIFNFISREAIIKGIGKVTLRKGGFEQRFSRGEVIDFNSLIDSPSGITSQPHTCEAQNLNSFDAEFLAEKPFWEYLHNIETDFHSALDKKDMTTLITKLLETDSYLWKAQHDLENPEFISQGREMFREMIVLAGTAIEYATFDLPSNFKALVNEMILLRDKYRKEKQWTAADHIRGRLLEVGVVVEDTNEGTRWHFVK